MVGGGVVGGVVRRAWWVSGVVGEWRGVAWCDVVWCGVAGVVWWACGVVRRVSWCGVGLAWCGVWGDSVLGAACRLGRSAAAWCLDARPVVVRDPMGC